ncbi:MAG: hypothetical protein K9J21_06780 [Bacteroidales bacterium]|nr:hypothetical protein [Bacteroidales bacterium]
MKVQILFIIVFLPYITLAQFEYIDQTDLYIENNINKVSSYFHDVDTVGLFDIWEVDTLGKITSKKEIYDDSTYSLTTYKYNDGLLNEVISRWFYSLLSNEILNTKNSNYSKQEYFYNDSNLLIKVHETNSKDNDTIITKYSYSNGLKIKSKTKNTKHNNWLIIDTLEYYDSNEIKIKTTLQYREGTLVFGTKRYYDTSGIIQAEINFDINRNCFDTKTIKTFIYDNNKLVRIKETILPGNQPFFKGLHTSEDKFTYDKNGLIIRVSRFVNGKLLNYDTYRYE